ncbi:MAG: AmmeMemoRadiSam system protein B [Deltaproteobacteria bacterium RBG_16_64_85]|nr:MAG: AmmeMemoRadiSam system protein B [Deltaproteobacteria bacterium RBG_16_64_85]
MIRAPAVAGQFYPGTQRELDLEVRRLTRDIPGKIRARGIVVPHAGYVYSGAVAGEVFSSVEIPDRQIIFCPNHTGMGAEAAVMTRGAWRMPWGEVPIAEDLAGRLLAASPLLTEDRSAHSREHSLEVQLPFLRRFLGAFRFVPIALGRLSLIDCRTLGEAVADVIRDDPSPPLLIASSDMTHYEPYATARKKDERAISRILALDPEGLYRTVRSERITMCGAIPTTVMLFAVLSLGATEARLIKYATSGDVSGDYGQVVGYAGLAVL